MLYNHLKIAFRRLWARRGFTFLNVFGLAIGVSACILILQYVRFERSYDDFHEHAEDIYRVQLEQYQSGDLVFASAENYPALGPKLEAEFPEVLAYARLYNLGAKNNIIVTNENAPGEPIKFKHRRLLYADPFLLPMFSYPVLAGDAETALAEPYKMVITESYAKKYFGEENPLGKALRMQDDDFNDELCEVTAVVADPPDNTHLKFDVLISYSTLFARYERARERYDQSWGRKDMYTYIRLQEGTDPALVEAKLPALIDQNIPNLAELNRKDVMRLQPLPDIHLYSKLADEPEINGDGRSVSILSIIALFILIIAYVNYINLSTARSLERANEVGIRKVVGAQRGQLIRQFLLESAIVNLLALVVAVLIVQLSLPAFNRLAGLSFSESASIFQLWQSGWIWAALAGLFIGGAFLSGLYPAFVLSSFRPLSVLGGKIRKAKSGRLFRRSLVVFQFATCVALIIGTITVYQQLNYMRQQELGFNPDQMLVIERPGVRQRNTETREGAIDAFKNELNANPDVRRVAGTLTIPGKKMRWKAAVRKYNDPPEAVQTLNLSWCDYDYLEAMDMEIIAGRNFSREMVTDADTACLITLSAVDKFGFATPEAALGQTITIDQYRFTCNIIGVVNDFHQESLRESVDPAMISLSEYGSEYYVAKLDASNLPQTLSFIEKSFNTHFPGNPFEYFFMDNLFEAQYRADQRFGQIFGLFSMLAIIVGCLGLFGLSAFAVQQRFKEIGVRKVLGATAGNIVVLLSKDFVRLILLANLIAWPFIGYLMNQWLQGFAYHVKLNWFLFVLAGLLVLVLALITVSFQSVRAALINPVESIQYE